jgi:hypothetical protein
MRSSWPFLPLILTGCLSPAVNDISPAVFLVVTSPRFDERDRIMVDAPP